MNVAAEKIIEQRPRLEALALRMIGNYDEAMDVVSDAIAIAWADVSAGWIGDDITGRMTDLVRNGSERCIRRRRKSRDLVIYAFQADEQPNGELAEEVQAALKAIPEVYRQALIDRFIDCVEDEIVAERDEVTEVTIRRRVMMAKEAFRQKFKSE